MVFANNHKNYARQLSVHIKKEITILLLSFLSEGLFQKAQHTLSAIALIMPLSKTTISGDGSAVAEIST